MFAMAKERVEETTQNSRELEALRRENESLKRELETLRKQKANSSTQTITVLERLNVRLE